MSEQDQYSWHEALDRTHCVLLMLDAMVESHPVIIENDRLDRLAEKAADAICALYQAIAQLRPPEEPKAKAGEQGAAGVAP